MLTFVRRLALAVAGVLALGSPALADTFTFSAPASAFSVFAPVGGYDGSTDVYGSAEVNLAGAEPGTTIDGEMERLVSFVVHWGDTVFNSAYYYRVDVDAGGEVTGFRFFYTDGELAGQLGDGTQNDDAVLFVSSESAFASASCTDCVSSTVAAPAPSPGQGAAGLIAALLGVLTLVGMRRRSSDRFGLASGIA